MSDTYTPDATETAENGVKKDPEGRKMRVRFGVLATQTVPHEWAESMLRHLFMTNKRAFARALQHAAGVDADNG